MKKLIVLICIVVLSACASIPTPNPVCERPGSETSVICAIAQQRGFAVEDLYYGLLDGTAMALIASRQSDKPFLTKLQVANFIHDLREFVVYNNPVTLASIVEYMDFRIDQAEDAQLMLGIMNRHIDSFRGVPTHLPEFDRQLIIEGCDKFLAGLFIK